METKALLFLRIAMTVVFVFLFLMSINPAGNCIESEKELQGNFYNGRFGFLA